MFLKLQILASSLNFHNVNSISLKKQNNHLFANDISFCANTVKEIPKSQIPSTVGRSMVTDSKTRLGANYDEKTKSVDFKLASKNATAVVLCVFDNPKDKVAKHNIEMTKKKGTDIWEASLPLSQKNKPIYYGFRVFGPNYQYSDEFFNDNSKGFVSLFDKEGNRFNPNKLAFDPYSRELSHLPSDNPKGPDAFITDENNYLKDNAQIAPKSVFVADKEIVIPKATPRPLTSEIIGEVHVKDLSINEDVEGKGTYLGAKNTAKKLKKMGFTMVEFLPVTEFDDKENGKNHWGYMPLGYFAPAKKYSSDKTPGGALREFREMVKEFHKNDLKVCLDMVYNHTGEAEIIGGNPKKSRQTSFSLIDNEMYYKQKEGIYNANSGCKNDFNVAQEETMNLIADSLAFFAKQGVDAFRFDLAAALLDTSTTDEVKYEASKSLAGKLKGMLKERGVNVLEPNQSGDGIYLIAEPWTCGGDYSYQLGNFPSFWAQWNDVARETYKRDSFFGYVTPRALKEVLEGSKGVLKGADKSINYAYSHDGFTLRDSNSYNKSEWHFATDYNGDKKRQEHAMKKQIALLMLSKGTPMLQVADIIAHTKNGDSNSYNKDDKTNYLDFSKAQVQNSLEQRIFDFATKMIKFRKEHPQLQSSSNGGQITYYNSQGNIISPDDCGYWDNHDANYLNYEITDKKGNNLYIATSSKGGWTDVNLPRPQNGKKWHLVLDTAREIPFEDVIIDGYYAQHPHSLLVFEQR